MRYLLLIGLFFVVGCAGIPKNTIPDPVVTKTVKLSTWHWFGIKPSAVDVFRARYEIWQAMNEQQRKVLLAADKDLMEKYIDYKAGKIFFGDINTDQKEIEDLQRLLDGVNK